MYVIRRHSDGWYFTNHRHSTWHPDIREAQTYLAPPVPFMQGIYAEERESVGISFPATLGLSLACWVALYFLVMYALTHLQ